LDIGCQIDGLTGLENSGVLKMNGLTMMVLAIVDSVKARRASRHADIFSTLGCEIRWRFVFNENRLIRALRDAGSAIDACIRIDVIPGPFIFWLAWYDALHRTNVHTSGITEAKPCDYMGHNPNLQ
jgi:hypothetical protein